MRYFYDYTNNTVRIIDDSGCPICGSEDCDCAKIAEDALDKLSSTLGKDFGVPNYRVWELFKRII